MSNLSWPISHELVTLLRHADRAQADYSILLENLAPKINTTLSTAKRWDGFARSLRGDLRMRIFSFLVIKLTERRWAAWLKKKRKRKLLLTIDEVAQDHLKVSRATVYRLIKRGELRASKVLGCTRIDPKELARFEQMIGAAN